MISEPTLEELTDTARTLGIHLTSRDAGIYLRLVRELLEPYNVVEKLTDELPPVTYPRVLGGQPARNDNPFNAWYYQTDIAGATSGKLVGKRIAIKDNICVAGVPMMNGVGALRGYVPNVDATVVTRVLDAGASVVGKAACELFCISGGSHSNNMGPVLNPVDPTRSAGGSSSGSAALVAGGIVDMALGTDQGGSVRIPSSYCGVVGMKPTYGLVPYTGAVGLDATLDHIGPITRDVASNACLLQVIAGCDGLDPRQRSVEVDEYSLDLQSGVDGLRIGLLKEGFGQERSDASVDTEVKAAAAALARRGAAVQDVSIPNHIVTEAVWSVIAVEGATARVLDGNGFGTNHKGLYVTGYMRALEEARRHLDDVSCDAKLFFLTGRYLLGKYQGIFYAEAQNAVRRMARAYDLALSKCDVLVMPTVPTIATKLPAVNADVGELCARSLQGSMNTCQFNATGHPALSVPCGSSRGLPVGMMIVGKYSSERVLYRVAAEVERVRQS